MSFYLGAFIIAWIIFFVTGKKSLAPWALVAGIIGLIQEMLGMIYGLWSYDNNMYALLSGVLGVYPVAGLLILTFLPRDMAARAGYVLAWSALSLLLETGYVRSGHLVYLQWNVIYSVLLYLVTYALFIAAYIYITRYEPVK